MEQTNLHADVERAEQKDGGGLGFQQSRGLGGGGESAALGQVRLSEGSTIPLSLPKIHCRTKISSHDLQPLKWDAQSQRYSVGLAEVAEATLSQDEESIPLITWGSREPTAPRCPPLSQLPELPSAACLNHLLVTWPRSWACACEAQICASPVKGPDLCRPDPPFPSQSWEMQNNLHDWAMTRPLFFTVWNNSHKRHWPDCRSVWHTCMYWTDERSPTPNLMLSLYLGKGVQSVISADLGHHRHHHRFYFISCLKGFNSFKSYFFCFLNVFFSELSAIPSTTKLCWSFISILWQTCFTLKYSRIHSAQAMSSEWGKKKANLHKRAGFSFSSHPP